MIAEDLTTLDQARAEAELIDLVAGLQQTRLVRALPLECKILAPYKVALRARFDVEISDILTLIHATNPHMVNAGFFLAIVKDHWLDSGGGDDVYKIMPGFGMSGLGISGLNRMACRLARNCVEEAAQPL